MKNVNIFTFFLLTTIIVISSCAKQYPYETRYIGGGEPPTDQKLVSQYHAITLSWKNPDYTGFQHILIRRDIGDYPKTPSDGVKVTETTAETYTDAGISPGTHYYYTLFAYYKDGTYNPGLPELNGTGYNIMNIQNFYALEANNQIKLVWNKPLDGDYAGVTIRKSTINFPESISDGDLIAACGEFNTETNCIDNDYIENTINYYSAFSYTIKDGIRNYAVEKATAKTNKKVLQYGTSGVDQVTSSEIDSSGNIYILGVTDSSFQGYTNQGNYDIFLSKINPQTQSVEWTLQYGTSEYDIAKSAIIDNNGNIYILGETEGAFQGYTNQGNYDTFISKINPQTQSVEWTLQYGTSEDEDGQSVIFDNSGNIYVAGGTTGAFQGYTNKGSFDIFITKINPQTQSVEWTLQYGTVGADRPKSFILNNSEYIYIIGNTTGAFQGYTNEGSFDIFITKINPQTQSAEWTLQYGTSGSDLASSAIVDNNENIYLGGTTTGAFQGFINEGTYDIFISKINPQIQSINWTLQYGTSGQDTATSTIQDNNGNIYMVGNTTGAFQGNTNQGYADIYLSRINPQTQSVDWTIQYGSSGGDSAVSTTQNNNGNIYTAGYTEGAFPGFINSGSIGTFDIFLLFF